MNSPKMCHCIHYKICHNMSLYPLSKYLIHGTQNMSYRSLTGLITAIRGLKHLLSSLFASTFASRAVSSTDNKFQQSDNLDLKTLPFLTIQLVPSPQLTGHWIQVFLLKKGDLRPCTPPSPPGSSCQKFSPPLRPPAGLQDG